MKREVIISAVGALLIGTFALVRPVLLPHEPAYQGKPLHLWLAEFDLSAAQRPEKAAEAVRTTGTNALPLLGRMIRFKDPPWKRAVISLNDRQSFIRLNVTEARMVRYRALEGYRVLGSTAGPSVPLLIHVLSTEPSAEVRADAAAALGMIGPEARAAIPALRKATKDPDLNLHRSALFAISNIERWVPPVIEGF